MAGIILVLASIDIIQSRNVSVILLEGHSIEIASAAYCALAFVAWLWLHTDDQDHRNWQIPVILALMCMRELDFDKRFTTDGVLQLRLYSGPAPIVEKLIGGAIVLLILICGIRLLLINLPRWLSGLRDGAATSWVIAMAGTLLIALKSLDGINRKLEPFGIELAPETVMMTTRAEEIFELAATMAMVMAVSYYSVHHSRDATSQI